MIRVTNLTNSPHELQRADGKVLVPAFGSLEGNFHREYVDLMVKCGSFRVEAVEPAASEQTKRRGKKAHAR